MAEKFYDIIPPGEAEAGEREEKKESVPQKGPRQKKSKKTPLFIKGLVICLVFLVLAGLAGFFLFSKTEIEIWPETKILTFQEKITLDLNASQSNFEEKVLAAKIFSDEQTLSRNFPATGKLLKKEKAGGIIRVYNGYSTSSRTLVPSRFVSAEGKLFWSTKQITIPGAKYEKGKLVPGEIDVEVVAAEAGQEYNIGPSTFALPGLAGTSLYTAIYAKSFSAMSGGFIGEAAQISQDDLDRAQNTLSEELERESRNSLENSLPSDFVILEETISREILEAKSGLKPGAEAESFNFDVKIKSEGVGFNKLELEKFAKDFVTLNISSKEKIQEESLELNYQPDTIDLASGLIKLNLEIKAKVYSDLDLEAVKKAILGKSFERAEFFLEGLSDIAKVEMKSQPFLRRKIPDNLEKVEIKLRID